MTGDELSGQTDGAAPGSVTGRSQRHMSDDETTRATAEREHAASDDDTEPAHDTERDEVERDHDTAADTGVGSDPSAANADHTDGSADPSAERLQSELEAARERIAELESALASERERADDLEDRLAEKRAEVDRYVERKEAEFEERKAAATAELVGDLLANVWGPLDRALDAEDPETLREGVDLTREEFRRVLAERGVEILDPEPGTLLDRERHTVVRSVPHDEYEAGRVVDVERPGFRLDDAVEREARVFVAEE